MTTTSVTNSSTGTSNNGYSTTSSQQALGQNYNTFLQLLTTQLKNQDPLDPQDSSQFTNQLVLFSQVEQQIDTNTTLSSMLANQNTGTAQQALSYLGLNVTANASAFDYAGTGNVNLGYDLPEATTSTNIGIFNSSGVEVYAGSGATTSGQQEFTWNGEDTSGNALPAGTYTIQVTGVDSTNAPVTATTQVPGQATAVSSSGGTTYLTVNGQQVALSDIVAAAEPSSSNYNQSSTN